ncbi:hypothetical protein ACQKP0_01375 [Heyndrickxia sp. NPDC080065]|uniref:hypothetical protein n=1 Tax=Heyndrickxia sp. NPDC080065 TaxID=3390568 RepID=UPI003D059FCF
MKLLGISIGVMGALMILSIGIDMLMGLTLPKAIINGINPFKVMDPVELFISIFFILLFFIDSIGTYIRNRKSKT